MVAPRTTWLYRPREDPEPRPGELRIESDRRALVFEAEAGGTFTLPFGDVARVRRLRGSPVLEIRYVRGGARRLAFHYFAEPPPMGKGPRLRPRTGEGRIGRLQASGMLGERGRDLREVLEEWVAAIRDAAAEDA